MLKNECLPKFYEDSLRNFCVFPATKVPIASVVPPNYVHVWDWLIKSVRSETDWRSEQFIKPVLYNEFLSLTLKTILSKIAITITEFLELIRRLTLYFTWLFNQQEKQNSGHKWLITDKKIFENCLINHFSLIQNNSFWAKMRQY